MRFVPFSSLTILLCLINGCTTTPEPNSSRFRGPSGSGHSSTTGLPLTWNASDNIIWKKSLPGYGASSPITLDDKIFLTCYSGYGVKEKGSAKKSDLRLHVVCLNRDDGNLIWQTAAVGNPEVEDYAQFVALHGYASATPVTDGKAVYAFFGSSGIFAYDINGKYMWEKKVGSKTHKFGTASSPVLHEDLVIVNATVESKSLVGLNKMTGKEVWRAKEVNDAWNTPIIVDVKDGPPELVLNMRNRIVAYDPKTGVELWHCNSTANDYICPSVIEQDGVIYAICGRSGKFVVVRAGGRGDVTETHKVWAVGGKTNVPSAVYHKGHIYWVSDEGIANCVNAKTGKEIYKERLPKTDRVYASVLYADGRLYNVTRERGTFVLAAKPEFELLAHNIIQGDESIFNASPIVSRGQFLLRSDKFLYCIGKAE